MINKNALKISLRKLEEKLITEEDYEKLRKNIIERKN